MGTLTFILWSSACFLGGATWAKNKAREEYPDLNLRLAAKIEDDVVAAKNYIVKRVNTYKEQTTRS